MDSKIENNMDKVSVLLPHGFYTGNSWLKEVQLREITG